MGLAFFIVDMQHGEQKEFRGNDWSTLTDTLVGLREALQPLGVPVLHFAMLDDCSNQPLRLGNFTTINRALVRDNGINLNRTPDMRFHFPVRPNDLVGLKDTFSAKTPAALRFLESRNIDTIIFGGVWEARPFPEGKNSACVTASAIDFADDGYRCIIAAEGTNYATDSVIKAKTKFRSQNFAKFNVEIMPIPRIIALAQNPAPPFPTAPRGNSARVLRGIGTPVGAN